MVKKITTTLLIIGFTVSSTLQGVLDGRMSPPIFLESPLSPDPDRLIREHFNCCMRQAEEHLSNNLEEEAVVFLMEALFLSESMGEFRKIQDRCIADKKCLILLMDAAEKGYFRIVELLLDDEIDPNLVGSETKLTPLQIACYDSSYRLSGEKRANRRKVIEALVRCKRIKINQTDGPFTALMWAAQKGFYEAVEILLSHPDVDVHFETNIDATRPIAHSGKNALNIATQALYTELYLREPNREDEDRFKERIRKTLASIYDYQRCIELLKERM